MPVMSRRFVNEISDGEAIDQIFVATQKQLRPNRQGNIYLQLRLMDRTGTINAMLWNANEKIYEQFENGDFIHVLGKAQFYNGAMQIIVQKISPGHESQVDPADFETLSRANVESMVAQLNESLRAIKNYHLRNLAECFLIDETFMAKFSQAPAGIKNHHAFQGGLLQHTISIIDTAKFVSPRYEGLDPDIMVMGAFLHDVGKIDELTYDRDLSYSDVGQLLGHLTLGVEILAEKIAEAEKLSGDPFPIELSVALKHIILSHHGSYEFGSPKLPMTLEAIAIHYIDTLDSKLNSVIQMIGEDVNKDSSWTTYFPAIDRKILKPNADFGSSEL